MRPSGKTPKIMVKTGKVTRTFSLSLRNAWERMARNLSLDISHKMKTQLQTGQFSFYLSILLRNLEIIAIM